MKKLVSIMAIATLCLALLAGCSAPPAQAADGAAWSEDWATLGSVLGAEAPENGLVLQDNNTALAASDMYYAFWTAGEPSAYNNEDGDEVQLYAARLDLLVCGCKNADAARETAADWQARQQETYTLGEARTESFNGQEYTVIAHTCDSETNPYSRGVTAFAVVGSYAVSAELNCQEGFAGDEEAMLAEFLEHCHYNAAIAGEK